MKDVKSFLHFMLSSSNRWLREVGVYILCINQNDHWWSRGITVSSNQYSPLRILSDVVRSGHVKQTVPSNAEKKPKLKIFCNITLYSLLKVNRHFRATYSGSKNMASKKPNEAGSKKGSVPPKCWLSYRTALHYVQADRNTTVRTSSPTWKKKIYIYIWQ
jgi:hypothetical protein